jgi:Flp pilus assembly protein TadD
MRTAGQEALPPALEAKITAAVHQLQSGDLGSAENAFSEVLRQGIKHPLIYHNLGVIAMLRGKRHAISSSACSSTGLWFLPLTPRY